MKIYKSTYDNVMWLEVLDGNMRLPFDEVEFDLAIRNVVLSYHGSISASLWHSACAEFAEIYTEEK